MIGQVEGTTIETTVERYFATWNETDAAARQAAIGATWTEDARYRDPLFAADGHTALDGMIAAVHDRMPVILPLDAVDTWLTGPPDAARALLKPYEGRVDLRVVGTFVSNVNNEGPECLEDARPGPQQQSLL